MNSALNPRNKLITVNNIQEILAKGEIYDEISDIAVYQKSFTHKSYIKNSGNAFIPLINNISDSQIVNYQDESNEIQEFHGDAVIGCVVCRYLCRRYPNKDEGFLTKLKTRLVDRKSLANFARYLDLSEWILISNHMENIHGRRTDKILEDVFESFIGAMDETFEFKITERFIINVLESTTNFSNLLHNDVNYKDRLLRYFQSKGWAPPVYTTKHVHGPPHKRTFTIETWLQKYDKNDKERKNLISKNMVGTGIGTSKKEAEQVASKNALEKFSML